MVGLDRERPDPSRAHVINRAIARGEVSPEVHTELAALRTEVEDLRRHVDGIEATRTWQLRNRVNRLLGR